MQIKVIQQEIGEGIGGLFRDSTVPKSWSSLMMFQQAIILVPPGLWYQAGTLLIWNDCRCHRSLQINFKVAMVNIAKIEEYLFV